MKIGHCLIRLESCTSTNDIAREYALKGAAEGTVILAKEQTQGRGRQGRAWYSPKNKGLYLSIILRPPISGLSLLPLLAGLAVEEALHRMGVSVGLKWPNDLVWSGRKVGGILSEGNYSGNRLNFAVVGIGLNLHHEEEDFPQRLRQSAASLRQISGAGVDKQAILPRLWKAFNRWYGLFLSGKAERIVEAFQKGCLFPLGAGLIVDGEEGKVRGRYRGIDRWGGLILECRGKQRSLYAAEIKSVREAKEA